MGNKILGLDIGIASVGWSLVEDEKKIIDLGVRTFEKAEVPKTGAPLNLIRRTSRLSRRRIYRRALRLKKLLEFLTKINLITYPQEILLNADNENPWLLRTKALTEVLSKNQLARVIYHICKHRGFYWVSTADREGGDSEQGKIKKSLSANEKLMKEKNYLTVGQMIYSEYPTCQRNKLGDYAKSLPRVLLGQEMQLIFEKQKELGSDLITDELVRAVLGKGDKKSGFLWYQKPALQGDALLNMVGRCRFESDEKRAPVACFLSERHVALTKLLNMRFINNLGDELSLSNEDIKELLPVLYSLKSDIKYSSIRASLKKLRRLPSDSELTIKGLKYTDKKDPESKVCIKLTAWQSIRSALEKNKLNDEWDDISSRALSGDYQRYDNIAYAFTVYKEDDDISQYLLSHGEKAEVIKALLVLSFKEFSSLSVKALSKIVPFMEQGLRYDLACEKAGYKHYLLSQDQKNKSKYLPPLYKGRTKTGTLILNDEIDDIPRNPVVLRAINQTRKVINAVVKKYGSPSSVHVELARDISKSAEKRREIQKFQEENRNRKEELKNKFLEMFSVSELNGRNLEKYRLYIEQDAKSLYSGKPIDINRLLEEGYVEVDHALPYSRSFDDSQNNKVLVFTNENRDKGNKTPREYFMSEQADWEEFVQRISSSKKISNAKKNRILKTNFDDNNSDFKDRNLNDTRYLSKFVKNYVDTYLKLDNENSKEKCVAVSGSITSILRAHWGLIKERSESDRHHAMDATVIACCTRSMIQRISTWSSVRECEFEQIKNPNAPTLDDNSKKPYKFPTPWDNFRTELLTRLKEDDKEKLKSTLSLLGTYDQTELDNVKPLFVSRLCQKPKTGALHDATVRRQTEQLAKEELAVSKIHLNNPKEAGRLVKVVDKAKNVREFNKKLLVDYDRNSNLYSVLEKRLAQNDWDPKKAFNAANPVLMPNKDGVESGPIVNSVRIVETQTGLRVRGGIAANGDMIRVDVYKKDKKYFIVPVYSWQLKDNLLPKKAAVANKPENEWVEIDDSYSFEFSLRRNELIKVITNKDLVYFGYFSGFDRSTASISVSVHDRNNEFQIGGKNPKNGEFRSLGVKAAKLFEKYQVDILGNYYKAPKEVRNELA